MDYERLRNVFSPAEMDVIQRHVRAFENLPWNLRQSVGLLRGYPENTDTAAFKVADAQNDKGWNCHKGKKYSEAIAHYESALQSCPNFAMVWNNKGLAHYRLRQLEKAKVAYLESIRLSPTFVAPYSNLGILYFELSEDNQQALTWFTKSLALDPNHQRTQIYVSAIRSGKTKLDFSALDNRGLS
jgi:tetratricopeptide (TPR) repeat protein